MFNNKILAVVLFMLMATTAYTRQTDTLQKVSSWKALVQQAETENKLIFVDLYFTGCHPCALMDKEVFPNELVRKELKENFIAVKVNVFEEKLGDTVNMKFGVTGFPTFLIFNPKGELLSYFSGYKDAGLLLHEINAAKKASKINKSYAGFAISNADIYPDFYKDYFDRVNGKRDYKAANAWLQQQKDMTVEPAAMAIFRTGTLDSDIENYVIDNYKTYLNFYGENLAQAKAVSILSSQMSKEVNPAEGEKGFRSFLKEKSILFPAEDWRVINFVLGNKYYSSIAKDTIGLLQFINEDPIVYMNYLGALYNNLSVRKQLSPQVLSLLCSWADKAVTPEAALDMMATAAYMHKENNDMEGYKKFVNMAIAKAKKYKIDSGKFERMLAVS